MKNTYTFLGSSVSQFATQQTLLTARIMIFLAMSLYPIIGYLYLFWLQDVLDPWSLRLTIVALLAIFYFLSFINNNVRSNISLISIVLFYILTSHILYLVYINHVNFYYVVGLIIVMTTSSVITNSLLSLLVYCTFTMVVGIAIAENTTYSIIDLNVFLLWLAITSCVSGVLLFVRLNLDLELNISHKIISKAKVLTLVFDKDGNVVRVSDSIKKILGYNKEELLGDGWWNMLKKTENSRLSKDVVKAYFKKENIESEDYIDEVVNKKDGSPCSLHWNFSRLTSGLLIGTSQDISELHESKKSIQKLYEESKLRSKELAEANEEYHDLMYTFSHDLKTPFRGVASLANVLVSDYEVSTEDQRKEKLKLLESKASAVYNLVDGFLEYSNIKHSYELDEDVLIEKLIHESVALLQVPKHISINVDGNLPTLKSKRFLMIQLFDKLLRNAIESISAKTGLINIKCEDNGQYYEFSIRDNGVGIDKASSNRIFKLFQTGKKIHGNGLGIGLAIAKKIVKIHNGFIWYESYEGKGTTFYFTLKKTNV